MFSDTKEFRSLIVGGASLLVLSLSACEERVAQPAAPSPSTQSAAVDPAPLPAAPQPPAPPPPAPAEPLPHYNVHFTLGSAQLTDTAMETLSSALDYLRANPAVYVTLSGYTDGSGAADTNKKLAEQRVERTAQFFEQNGIQRSRLTTMAIGEAEAALVPPGENPESWNRRVEIALSHAPNT